VAASAVAFMLETGNTTLLPRAQAFQAELALMQGRVATASQWAAQRDPVPSLSPSYGFFSPDLTLAKVWLAQDTPASRGQAADLLGRLGTYVESTHNIRFSIETLALQARLYHAEGDEAAALSALEQAIILAEPSGFLRLFVDLGPPLERLLNRLRRQGRAKGSLAPEYITQILSAFGRENGASAESADRKLRQEEREAAIRPPAAPLIEPLTPRELEVLELLDRRLTNREIAEALIVSPSTVKTHTLNIYRKLGVHGRKQAVARARELSIL
jgi:LuxR family maltose regulon positive regulatory protein